MGRFKTGVRATSLLFIFATLVALPSCGGEDILTSLTAAEDEGATGGTVKPSGLRYAQPAAAYVRSSTVPIPPNIPTLAAGDSIKYSVTPALPSGLALNASSGVISGYATTDSGAAPGFSSYTVKAANSLGSTTYVLRLVVGTGYRVNDTGMTADVSGADGLCKTGTGSCTLKAALTQTVADAAPRIIYLPNGTYILNSALSLAGSGALNLVHLSGQSRNGTVIDGANAYKIFRFTGTLQPTLTNLTLQHANVSDEGGAIEYEVSTGLLTAINVAFKDNYADDGGAAIQFHDNKAVFEEVLFTGNSSDMGSGAVGCETGVSGGALSISTGHFEGNLSLNGDGGALGCPADLADVVFKDNAADNGSGGGMYDPGGAAATSWVGCVFDGNSAEDGGGAYSATDSLNIRGATFSNNTASNSGGGAILDGDGVTATNVTFAANTSIADGAGLASTGDLLTLRYATFFNNTAGNVSAGGGALVVSGGGASSVGKSVFSGNVSNGAPQSCRIVNPSYASGGYNVFNTAGGACGTAAGSDVTVASVGLGALGDHGGSLETVELTAGSAAINLIPSGSCAESEDARGYVRASACDAGAFEY